MLTAQEAGSCHYIHKTEMNTFEAPLFSRGISLGRDFAVDTGLVLVVFLMARHTRKCTWLRDLVAMQGGVTGSGEAGGGVLARDFGSKLW